MYIYLVFIIHKLYNIHIKQTYRVLYYYNLRSTLLKTVKIYFIPIPTTAVHVLLYYCMMYVYILLLLQHVLLFNCYLM